MEQPNGILGTPRKRLNWKLNENEKQVSADHVTVTNALELKNTGFGAPLFFTFLKQKQVSEHVTLTYARAFFCCGVAATTLESQTWTRRGKCDN